MEKGKTKPSNLSTQPLSLDRGCVEFYLETTTQTIRKTKCDTVLVCETPFIEPVDEVCLIVSVCHKVRYEYKGLVDTNDDDKVVGVTFALPATTYTRAWYYIILRRPEKHLTIAKGILMR